ncbi:cell division topological specificity factor MinE [Hydrogenovibrio sp. 3SP14C1]|uniref:Cell division topological specificity factor n=2 Tax=Hydrogenovibrio crunogenus TaxID=39765 RepID=MINE_HYDCU|nr:MULTISPECIES: cell division topological specificity factor MinE [Hydrogenovibrio]Q31GG2.1 RecName: Full=Cell division topological specificity factor [Hydrogenovibrio crunogenus XCL-2]MDG4813463.1 cell division topological specificity factor MinE [Hydrogenovibrio sp. 3SP14C1]QBZ83193.1 Cell division topological specificity factor [Hydrogenovibrio crunogenus]RUM93358.1 MAG: cell division topological specificity factor MinE [Thiomicrospira sp.]
MALLDYLLGQKKKKSANLAKDRLQILLAHERSERSAPEYLPKMREEILAVISKYVTIDQEQLQISIDEANGFEVLELNLVLPDK